MCPLFPLPAGRCARAHARCVDLTPGRCRGRAGPGGVWDATPTSFLLRSICAGLKGTQRFFIKRNVPDLQRFFSFFPLGMGCTTHVIIKGFVLYHTTHDMLSGSHSEFRVQSYYEQNNSKPTKLAL